MTMTYPTNPDDSLRPYGESVRPHGEMPAREVEIFVPAYARSGRRKNKGIRTWMILAPIGALALAVGAVVVLTAPSTETRPLVQAEPGLSPLTPAPAALDPTIVVPPATPVAAATVEAPPPPPAIQRRVAATPAARRVAPAPRTEARPAAVVATSAEPTGPRAYTASPSTATTVTPAPTPASPPPVIVIAPAG